jgi:hypothetical protein
MKHIDSMEIGYWLSYFLTYPEQIIVWLIERREKKKAKPE